MSFGNCFICNTPCTIKKSLHIMICACPHGALVCSGCKSISGQRTYIGSKVCRHCSNKNKDSCNHAEPLLCRICRVSGYIVHGSIHFSRMVQNWFYLQENKKLFCRNVYLAKIAEDWRMFSKFYYRGFCIKNDFTLWSQQKKQDFFQLWLLSQMNYPIGPRMMMSIRSNLWESYPHFQLYISREFSWRFCQFPWVRKLICNIAVSCPKPCDGKRLFMQSYLHRCIYTRQRMMSLIINYLMAKNAQIFRLTF